MSIGAGDGRPDGVIDLFFQTAYVAYAAPILYFECRRCAEITLFSSSSLSSGEVRCLPVARRDSVGPLYVGAKRAL